MTIDATIRKLYEYNDALAVTQSSLGIASKASLRVEPKRSGTAVVEPIKTSTRITTMEFTRPSILRPNNDADILKKLYDTNTKIISLLKYFSDHYFLDKKTLQSLMSELNNDYPDLDGFINALHHSLLRTQADNIWLMALNLNHYDPKRLETIRVFAYRAFVVVWMATAMVVAAMHAKVMLTTLLIAGVVGLIATPILSKLLKRAFRSDATTTNAPLPLTATIFSAPVIAALYTGMFTTTICPAFAIAASVIMLGKMLSKIEEQKRERSAKWQEIGDDFKQMLETPTNRLSDDPSVGLGDSYGFLPEPVGFLASEAPLSEQWSQFRLQYLSVFKVVKQSHDNEYLHTAHSSNTDTRSEFPELKPYASFG